MKTLVELYVNEQFDDLAASLAFRPERTVFLLPEQVPDKAARNGILRFLRSLNSEAEAHFINIGDRSIDTLFKKIDEVFAKYPDCAVEMTGGSPSVLIACQRYCESKRARSFFFDRVKGKFRNIYGMEDEIRNVRLPVLDIDLLLKMGGGVKLGNGHTTKPLEENSECVYKLLEVYRSELGSWNSFSEYLQFAVRSFCDTKKQYFCAPNALLNKRSILFANRRILTGLSEAGAILDYTTDGENISFFFRNGFIRDILTTVGMCLELYIFTAARDFGFFDYAEMSVCFDWDGIISGNSNDTTNELDVVATRGLASTFISCKTAKPDNRDLYEISYLAERFGGRNSRAVLATAFDFSGAAWASYLRARDMGVAVIEMADIIKGREHVAKLLASPEWLDERPAKQVL